MRVAVPVDVAKESNPQFRLGYESQAIGMEIGGPMRFMRAKVLPCGGQQSTSLPFSQHSLFTRPLAHR